MRKWIVLLGILLLSNLYKYNVFCESEKNIHVIYSDLSVDKNEEFLITLNFEQVELYSSIQLVFEIGEYFEVVNDVPCELLINSYYNSDEVYVNDIENNVIRFVAFKKTNENLPTFNNIVQITLRSKINCKDVREYLQNIKIGLFGVDYQTIPVNVVTSEGIKVEWLKDSYEIKLGDQLPDFSNDINISNRKDSEFIIKIITDKIDINKVGSQVVTVYVYDFTNSSCIILTKAINIVDTEKPIISGKPEIVINDFELSKEHLYDFEVIDNYDQNPLIIISYYNRNGDEILNENDFFTYLKNNLSGVIKVTAKDFSKNESDEFVQTIKINDTTAPSININNLIEIMDYEIESFDINKYLTVFDSYDQNPIIKYFINETENPDIILELNKTYKVNLLIYAYDLSQNRSEEVNVEILLVDTTPPTIEKTDDLIIKDSEFSDLNLMINNVIKTSDNFKLPLDITCEYYNVDKVIEKDTFINLLYQGIKLKVKVYALDSFLNKSNQITLDVQLIDTTSPTITVKNIEENKKYLTIPNIDYSVSDNFNNDLTVELLLDGEIYQNTPINIIGSHTLVVNAKDASGNETTKTIKFEIIKNNLIGCGLDAECYSENYQTIIYIAFSILTLAVLIFLVKIIIKKNKTKIH